MSVFSTINPWKSWHCLSISREVPSILVSHDGINILKLVWSNVEIWLLEALHQLGCFSFIESCALSFSYLPPHFSCYLSSFFWMRNTCINEQKYVGRTRFPTQMIGMKVLIEKHLVKKKKEEKYKTCWRESSRHINPIPNFILLLTFPSRTFLFLYYFFKKIKKW